LVTKEQLEEKKRLQEIDEEDFQDKTLTRQQKQQIRENIWYKLYMLQNYNITMEMFTGSDLRWSSINTYLGYIRAIYQGKQYKEELRTKSLVNYIQGLIDSGTEPYPTIESQDKLVTIKELIDSKLLTQHEIDQIYESVGITKELPDTSQAWTRTSSEIERHGGGHNTYYTIVEEKPGLNMMSNPIKKLKMNFLGFKLKTNPKFSLFRL
jgi:hypothetical protein